MSGRSFPQPKNPNRQIWQDCDRSAFKALIGKHSAKQSLPSRGRTSAADPERNRLETYP
jgi:hypothetical protein